MVSTRCAVSFCKNTRYKVKQQNANITFHTFPADQDVCRKWVEFCQQKKSWNPSRQSIVCSEHFKPEDYQMSQLPFHERRIELRRLHSTAVPSITTGNSMIKIEIDNSDEPQEHLKTDCNIQEAVDPIVLKYRDQICRTCMNPCSKDSSVSIYSQLHNITVLDMIIQLTAFETEHNEAYPTVICLDCKHKLDLAYNIRQEFIMQTELLVQFVAENTVQFYTSKVPNEMAKSSSELIGASIKSRSTDSDELLYNAFTNEGMLSNDGDIIVQGQQEQFIALRDEPSNNFVVQLLAEQSEIYDPTDHSGYTKIINGYEDPAIGCRQTIYLEDSTCEVDYVCSEKSASNMIPDCQGEQLQGLNEKSDVTDGWEDFQRDYEQEKASIRKRRAELRRSLRNQNKSFKSKAKRLEEEARKRFPRTTCYICDNEHDSVVNLELHLREHISMLPYQCNDCVEPNLANNTQGSNETHETNNPVEHRPIILKTTNQVNLHFRMHRMPHKCEKCYRRFSTVMKLKTHLWALHGYGESGLTCEYCGKQYFHRAVFRTHVAHHRNEMSGQFKCTICDRTFGVKSSLQRHEASHKGERKYKCLYCDKSFSTSYNRLTHQRTHTGERPFKCETCDRAFAQSTTLKAHQKLCPAGEMRSPRVRVRGPTLLPSKDGRCPYPGCDYTATTYATMYVHKRSKHMPVHQCEICNKPFAFANNLKDHMMLHTGEKPFKCETCDRSFRRVEMYKRHLLTHKTDSNYLCPICQKSFKIPQYLQAHILTHSSERKFACESCGNSYKTKGELKKHTLRKHVVKTEEEIIVKTEDSYEV